MPNFRPAALDDLPILLPLMIEFNREGSYPADSNRTEKLLATFLAQPALGQAWFIESDGGIAGYLVLCHCFSFEHGGPDAFLDEIYVRPAFRQRGLGHAALAFLQKYAVEQGIHALHLEVEQGNAPARALYKKSGFTDPQRPLLTWKPTSK